LSCLGIQCTRLLIGQALRSVEKHDFTWCFSFTGGVSLATDAEWRLIDGGRVVTSSDDHGRQFGLPAPVDAARNAAERAAGRTVETASVLPEAGDLVVRFGDRLELQLLQLSCGHESWRLTAAGGEHVCTGGGAIVFVPRA
jgi:hypothetical protein